MQFVSSTALTAMSVTVGVVAAVIGYRNSNGWRPLLVVTGQSLIPMKRPDGISVWTEFEVWNRRKYPVVVRQMFVRFDEVKLTEVILANANEEKDGEEEKDNWHVTWNHRIVNRYGQFVLEAGKHARFAVRAKFEPLKPDFDTLARMRGKVRVQVYDPKIDKHILLKALGPQDGRSSDVSFDS